MSNSPTITCAGRSRLQAESHRRAGRLAAALARAGVRHGDNIAIVARNDIEFLEISLAAGQAGANPVPINWHWGSHEIAHVVRDADVKIVFAHSTFLRTVGAALSIAASAARIVRVDLPPELSTALQQSLADSTANSFDSLEDWIASEPEPLPYQDGALANSMGLVYTSGTTGAPKGVKRDPMTPDQLLAIATSSVQRMGITASGCVLIAGPLYHTSPSAVAMLALRIGADIVIMPKFDPEDFLRSVEAHRVQQAKIVPTMLSRLLSLPASVRAAHDVSSLTHLIHSSAPCPPGIKRAAIEWFGDALWEFYGCSEAGTITWISAREWINHPGSVGRPVDGAAVVISDAAGHQLPPDRVGNVWVRSADYWPAFKYLNQKPDYSSTIVEGYITVGDHGFLDADGWLYLTGRDSDIIISGGVNIYAAEVEAALLDTGAVEDAAVYGVLDDEWGEVVAAQVILRPTTIRSTEQLLHELRGRLANYKLPRKIQFTDRLPRDDSGKLYRNALQDAYRRRV